MKELLAASAALLLAAGAGLAVTVVADLDGDPTNGIDHIQVPVGALVDADLWIVGPPWHAIVVGAILCNYDHSLIYQACVYNLPDGAWFGDAPPPPDEDNCIMILAQTLAPPPEMTLPWRFCTLVYRAAVDQTIDTLVATDGSGIISSFEPTYFVNNGEALCYIQIGQTATETTSWGSIKAMFR